MQRAGSPVFSDTSQAYPPNHHTNDLWTERHHQRCLRRAVAQDDVSHVEQRGPVWRACVYHLEHRLEISIQIDDRTSRA